MPGNVKKDRAMSSPPETPSSEKEERRALLYPLRQFWVNMLSPLRVRNFRLLFSGQMISTLGDAFYAVALPWLLLTSGHSPQDLGIVLACYGVPRVATLLIGGALSDRLGPRGVMLLSDCTRALLTGLLVALVIAGSPPVWQLCAIAIPLGGFT